MQKLINKVAPLGLMTACAIWCCWAQLRDSTPLLAATEAKLPRIERKLLDPDMSPRGERDPFLQHKPVTAPVVEEVMTVQEAAPEPEFDPRTMLPSLVLDATILGSRRLAVISGKIHLEGERVFLEDVPEIRVRLVSVLRDKIVVTIEDETFHITHSHKTRAPAQQASQAKAVPQAPEAAGNELPEGTPSPDELDQAVADSLARQALAAIDEGNLDAAEPDERRPPGAQEDCEFENDLSITDKLRELFNHDE